MTPATFLGKTFDCKCGRRHAVPTEYYRYCDDAIQQLAGIIGRHAVSPVVAVLSDTRTFEAAGQQVVAELKHAGALVATLLVPDRKGRSPISDERTFAYIAEKAPPVETFIAVGSGVINDLTKWLAHERQKPFFTVPTAASMNGYASANVSATVGGLKSLFIARASKGVFAVPAIIENAPFELTASGLGDAIARTVSSADWKLNQFLFGEYYCPFSVDLLKTFETVYLDNPDRIKRREPGAIQALFDALFYSGIAMTITETSSPASGAEHLLSHTIDMLSTEKEQEHDFHGRQVGFGTLLAAALYEKVLEIDRPAFKQINEEIDQNFWGALTGTVAAEYAKKGWKCRKAAQILSRQRKWDDLRSSLRELLVPAEKIKQCLKRAGAAHRSQHIRIAGKKSKTEMLRRMWIHANEMRDRFTILDLAKMLGIMPDAADEIFRKWA